MLKRNFLNIFCLHNISCLISLFAFIIFAWNILHFLRYSLENRVEYNVLLKE